MKFDIEDDRYEEQQKLLKDFIERIKIKEFCFTGSSNRFIGINLCSRTEESGNI
jgi:hypothetical protein